MSETRRYDYFKYHLPTESAETYAGRALQILKELKQEFPQFYTEFRYPSEVLTLSGVRAFDTYYALGEQAQAVDIEKLCQYLKERGIWVMLEDLPMIVGESNPEHRYSLVHEAALYRLPEQYGFIPEWHDIDMNGVMRPADFFLWWGLWKEGIMGKFDPIKGMPDSWSGSWINAHNITFGMLLGYPGEAICSILYEDADVKQGREYLRANTLVPDEIQRQLAADTYISAEARIAHAFDFDGAVPIYDYEYRLRENHHIRAHEKLWSDILSKVYEELSED